MSAKAIRELNSIANFTNVAATFTGIISVLKAYTNELSEGNISIWMRRGGPNYQDGLRGMRNLSPQLGITGKAFRPEATSPPSCRSRSARRTSLRPWSSTQWTSATGRPTTKHSPASAAAGNPALASAKSTDNLNGESRTEHRPLPANIRILDEPRAQCLDERALACSRQKVAPILQAYFIQPQLPCPMARTLRVL